MSSYILSVNVMLCYVMVCYVVFCYVQLYHSVDVTGNSYGTYGRMGLGYLFKQQTKTQVSPSVDDTTNSNTNHFFLGVGHGKVGFAGTISPTGRKIIH